jgi:ribosomal protection tetracycline resistance protein
VCEPVLRVVLEVPTETATALQRVVTRWGAELLGQTVVGDLTRLELRLVATRLHELQRQLPDLTGGEGTLESRFDGYEPVRGRPPARRGWRQAESSGPEPTQAGHTSNCGPVPT